jgi:hypothetical protein
MKTKPDVVIPSCDRGVAHLHELYARSVSGGDVGWEVADLIERSLGPPASYSIVSSRYELLALAREEGVRVPSISRVNSKEELESWQTQETFPWVLKVDGTWGGCGVRIVRSSKEADQSFTQLARMSRCVRAIKRLVVNRDSFWLRPWWNQSKRDITAQSYIGGRPANCTVFCWKGHVLAVIGVEVVYSEGPTGPASVIRVIDNADMVSAACKIASRLSLSGFFGLDFMIEDGSNAVYLIEMNPRLTPPCHIRLGKGRDLVGALWAQLSDQASPDDEPTTQNQIIAYFPQSTRCAGDLLKHCFQDVPYGEPDLIDELLHPFPDRTLLYRLFRSLANPPTFTEHCQESALLELCPATSHVLSRAEGLKTNT